MEHGWRSWIIYQYTLEGGCLGNVCLPKDLVTVKPWAIIIPITVVPLENRMDVNHIMKAAYESPTLLSNYRATFISHLSFGHPCKFSLDHKHTTDYAPQKL